MNLDIDNHNLIEECRAGNRDALGILYNKFAPKMLGVISRYIPSQADAQDILHDGFIVAFTRLNSLKDPDKLEFWLATIMKNLALQFLQSQDIVEVLENLPDDGDTPEIEEFIDLEVLESLIKKLPSGYQTVFRLSVLENKSHKEIAKILGIAPNSSSSQLFHAKMMMRRLVNDYRIQSGMATLCIIIAAISFILKKSLETDHIHNINIAAVENTSLDSKQHLPAEEHGRNIAKNTNSVTIASIPRKAVNNTSKSIIAGGIKFPATDTDTCSNFTIPSPIPSESEEISEEERNNSHYASLKDSTSRDTQSEKLVAVEKTYPYDYEVDQFQPLLGQTPRRRRQSGWAISAGANLLNLDIRYDSGKDTTDDFPGKDPMPDKGEEDKEEDTQNHSPKSNIQDKAQRVYRKPYLPHKNDLPLSFLISAKKSFSERWAIETGLMYTYLHSSFSYGATNRECRWHYLGVPLRISLNALTYRNFKLYASLGVQVDFPLVSTLSEPIEIVNLQAGRFESPIVFSASASCGLSYDISSRLGIFIEPSLQWHFKNEYYIPNAWSDNPLSFALPIGLRIYF